MALGVPNERATLSGTNSGATSGSLTIPAGDEIRVLLGSGKGGGGSFPPSEFTISDTQGLTWTSVLNTPENFGSGPDFRGQIWRATSNGNATQITLTVGASAPSRWVAKIVSVSGAESGGSNAIMGVSTSGDPSGTLPTAPASASTVLSLYFGFGAVPLTEPTGFTEISEANFGAFCGGLAYDAGSPAQTNAWSSRDSNSIALFIEVKELPTHALAANSLIAPVPVLGSPTLVQLHALAADSLTAPVPVLASPSIVHIVGVAANDLIAPVPVLESPAIAQLHAMVADALLAPVPILGSPALAQHQIIIPDDLVAPLPDLAEPTILQLYPIIADSLTAPVAVLDSATLLQLHALIADDLVAPVPILGTPKLFLLLLTPASRTVLLNGRSRNVVLDSLSRIAQLTACSRTATLRKDY